MALFKKKVVVFDSKNGGKVEGVKHPKTSSSFTPKRHPVFVYGTLRKDCINEHRMFDLGGERVGFGCTVDSYRMTVQGRVPYIDPGHKDTRVSGDLWMMTNKGLRELDRFEGHPKWYTRKLIDIIMNGRKVRAWCYLNWRTTGNVRVGDGDYRAWYLANSDTEEKAHELEVKDNIRMGSRLIEKFGWQRMLDCMADTARHEGRESLASEIEELALKHLY